jgi:glycosyltransferase involved in cell wall biosynthesis
MREMRAQRPSVIYINGFFAAPLSILPQLLWRVAYWRDAVRLVAPRGEFGRGALARRTSKKRAYMLVYRLLRLNHHLYWHASSEIEADDIRRIWGDSANIVVRENETLLPPLAARIPDKPASGKGLTQLVFLGRLVPHKGLDIVLRALGHLTHAAQLDVYGPEEDVAYTQLCKVLATELPSWIRVRFLPPLKPDSVRDTLSAYDLMLVPTAGENFGHVIAESLSVSCPVMCTPYTPWSETLLSGGGVVVEDRSEERWAHHLAAYTSLTADGRLQFRQRAGEAYDRWSAAPKGPHVFKLLSDALEVVSHR